MVVDDYAHHPTEVEATLNAARKGWKRRIVAVFQPHLYSRTRDFADAFGRSLSLADVVIITDVYPAREKPIEGVSGKMVVDSIEKFGHKNVHYQPVLAKVAQDVSKRIKAGDMVITLGAGNVWKVARELLENLSKGD